MTANLTGDCEKPGGLTIQSRPAITKAGRGQSERYSIVGGKREQCAAVLDDMQRDLEGSAPEQWIHAAVTADQPAARDYRAGPPAVQVLRFPARHEQAGRLNS